MIIATKIRVLGAAAVVGLFGAFAGPQPAHAVLIGFDNISANDVGGEDVATGEAQLTVDVMAVGSNQVSFLFTNAVGAASSITDVYWDDGTLLGISEITFSPGVLFLDSASPGNLPSGNSIDPNFVASAGFSADSSAPMLSANGVDAADEWLKVIFSLVEGGTFADVLTELLNGDLRIGIHVQAFEGGGSESFVNCDLDDSDCDPTFRRVPEPATLLLFGIGLLGLGVFARRRRRFAA